MFLEIIMSYFVGMDYEDTVCGVEYRDLCIFEGTDNIFYFTFSNTDGTDKDMTDYAGEARIITTDGEINNFTLTHVIGEVNKLRLTVPYNIDFTETSGAWFLNITGPLSGDSKITRAVIGNVLIIEDNLGLNPPNYLLGINGTDFVLGTQSDEAIQVVI
jgi:hypothetical protein